VAEQENLTDGNADNHRERDAVAPELPQFLAHDGEQPYQGVHAARPTASASRVTATNTSSSDAATIRESACRAADESASPTSSRGASTSDGTRTRNLTPSCVTLLTSSSFDSSACAREGESARTSMIVIPVF